MTDLAKVACLMIFIGACMIAIGTAVPSNKPQPETKIEYRYYGDKSKPDRWLRKYTVPASYHVWDYEVNHYVEVTKEKYDATPSEDTK